MTILFLHGWQSTPGGLKPTYLKDHGHSVLNPKLPDDDFQQAVRIAQSEYDQNQPDVVVGSIRSCARSAHLRCPAVRRGQYDTPYTAFFCTAGGSSFCATARKRNAEKAAL